VVGAAGVTFQTNFKPPKGTAWKALKQRKADIKTHERKVMDEARKRDGGVCRVPRCEHAPRKPRIEVAHQNHRGMGGNPTGDKTTRQTCIALCWLHHCDYDWKTLVDLDIRPETAQGFDGPCSYYFRALGGPWIHYATEKRIGISTAVGA
jgi:hypothetical protein